jgi:hypothetical protein
MKNPIDNLRWKMALFPFYRDKSKKLVSKLKEVKI